MVHQLIAEFMGTALMIIFGVGVHCSSVLKGTKYRASGNSIRAISLWKRTRTVGKPKLRKYFSAAIT
ncbi:hypothetical protein WP50_30530 [Lactiplantibacillus plantarum]|nr:hypothetical protein WP50_30530 [Lactiplantibacillus plantarum]